MYYLRSQVPVQAHEGKAVLVATYRTGQQKVRVMREVRTPRRWLLKAWVSNGVDRFTADIRSKEPCMASDMAVHGHAAIDDLGKSLPDRTDGGWQLILLR